jgi:lysozyme
MAPVTTQSQFDALVSFAYNVGLSALNDSTLLRLHKAGDYAGAKAQFARWDKNDGKVIKGLARRRAAEAALYGAAT